MVTDPSRRRLGRHRRPCARAATMALVLLAACGGPEERGNTGAAPPTSKDSVAPAAPTPDDATPLEAGEVKWVAAHQSASGRWQADEWDRWRMGERVAGERLPGRGSASLDVAMTSLALLAYAGAGYTPSDTTHVGAVVAWGLHAVREAQDTDGAFGDPKDPTWPVNQGLAIYALASHAALENDPRLVETVRRGIARYRKSRAVEPARWTSDRVFGGLPAFAWIALASSRPLVERTMGPRRGDASALGLETDRALARDRADVASWITLPEAQRTLAKVGAGLALGAGEGKEWGQLPTVVAAAGWLAERAPRWEPSGEGVDAMGWWLGTMGVFAAGGDGWKRWEAAMKPAIIDTQRRDGDPCELKGSWDPLGAGAEEGGRLFMTLTCALSTEVWYRYDQVLGVPEAASPTRPSREPTSRKPARVERALPRRRYSPCR